ncbi:hypothetical protein [Aeromonas veronii]|nr:hypothetical protein [Aeromonas veronii]
MRTALHLVAARGWEHGHANWQACGKILNKGTNAEWQGAGLEYQQ